VAKSDIPTVSFLFPTFWGCKYKYVNIYNTIIKAINKFVVHHLIFTTAVLSHSIPSIPDPMMLFSLRHHRIRTKRKLKKRTKGE